MDESDIIKKAFKKLKAFFMRICLVTYYLYISDFKA